MEVYAFRMPESVQSDITTAEPTSEQKNSGGLLKKLKRIAMRITLISSVTSAAAVAVLLQEDERPPINQSLTNDDLLRIIRKELGDVAFVKYSRRSFDTEEDTDDPGIAAMTMVGNLMSTLNEKSDQLPEVMDASLAYLSTYRLSVESAESCDPDCLDCNDDANMTCERLSQYGIPMYLVCIWPLDPDERMSHPWHEMAACKIAEKEFLIFDNGGKTIYWKDELEEFGYNYHRIRKNTVPMALIPHIGVSPYVPPKYDCAASKFLLQARHMTEPADMHMLELRKKYGSVAQID